MQWEELMAGCNDGSQWEEPIEIETRVNIHLARKNKQGQCTKKIVCNTFSL